MKNKSLIINTARSEKEVGNITVGLEIKYYCILKSEKTDL